jgi:glycosyltransferase involved in cell wall biosynthesis
MYLAIIWQRFLPYHWARIRYANKRLSELGFQFTAVEVASQDVSYGFPSNSMNDKSNYICCFPGESYHSLRSKEVYKKVLEVLNDVKPDIIFAPAIAFPEGIAAVAYRMTSGARIVSMDDTWEHTDRRGFLVKLIRRLIYRNVDAVFVPSASHLSYYTGLGFAKERIIFGVDVVDNEYFMKQAELVHHKEPEIRDALQLPDNYFLFVGRILPRKGIEILLKAYKQYRETAKGEMWDLVIVGSGDYLNSLCTKFSDVSGLHYAGAQFGDNLCKYYGLAKVLIVPSDSDPWGLVVNEAMASGLPVIVSSGCGAAKTLVRDAENGWIFKQGNVDELKNLMHRITLLDIATMRKMGNKSREIIGYWTLDRFADSVLSSMNIQKRPQAGLISDVLTRLWKGRVQVT